MDRQQAKEILDKKVKIVTKNNFHFTGKVIDVLDDSLIIFDRFGERVTLNFDIIMICSEENANGAY